MAWRISNGKVGQVNILIVSLVFNCILFQPKT